MTALPFDLPLGSGGSRRLDDSATQLTPVLPELGGALGTLLDPARVCQHQLPLSQPQRAAAIGGVTPAVDTVVGASPTALLRTRSEARPSLRTSRASGRDERRADDAPLRLVEQLVGEVASIAEPSILIASAVDRVRTVLGVDACHYHEVTADQTRLRVRMSSCTTTAVARTTMSMSTGSLGGYALLCPGPVIVPDTAAERRFGIPATYVERGVASIATMGVAVRGVPVGMLSVESRLPNRFTDRDAGVLRTVAELIALAEERYRSTATQRALQRISGALSGNATDETRMVADVERILADHLDSACVIWLADPNRPEPGTDTWLPGAVKRERVAVASGPPLSTGAGVVGDQMANRLRIDQMLVGYSSPGDDGRTLPSFDEPLHVMRVPLIDDGKALGSVTCRRAASLSPFGQTDKALLTEAAERLMAAVVNARLRASLEERQSRLDDALEQLVSIEESERRRVALCIHDGLAQVAASAYRHLEVFDSNYSTDNPQDASDLARAKELARRTIREARLLIADLRPTVLDEFGLISALQAEVDDLRFGGWDVRFEHTLGDERFPRRLELDLFRLAQEALANVSKHAGKTRVDLSVTRLPESIQLVVRDHGAGFDPDRLPRSTRSSEHVGLAGMKERVNLLGGAVTIQSRPGEGTRVAADIPA